MIVDYALRLKVVRADRRKAVRRLRAAGLSVREIAEQLGVSHPTVLADLGEEPAREAGETNGRVVG